jgi:tetratricopeptide (TPR) repeat protein
VNGHAAALDNYIADVLRLIQESEALSTANSQRIGEIDIQLKKIKDKTDSFSDWGILSGTSYDELAKLRSARDNMVGEKNALLAVNVQQAQYRQKLNDRRGSLQKDRSSFMQEVPELKENIARMRSTINNLFKQVNELWTSATQVIYKAGRISGMIQMVEICMTRINGLIEYNRSKYSEAIQYIDEAQKGNEESLVKAKIALREAGVEQTEIEKMTLIDMKEIIDTEKEDLDNSKKMLDSTVEDTINIIDGANAVANDVSNDNMEAIQRMEEMNQNNITWYNRLIDFWYNLVGEIKAVIHNI